jgi:drug/metabolite transporter (DMT)-like permease
MSKSFNPSCVPAPSVDAESAGMLLGLAGVAIFSLTLPFTRLAVASLDPTFVALGRALVAALLAATWLSLKRSPLPPRSSLPGLAAVAAGCVIGFPWLTSFALQTLPASHGAVLAGIMPLATAALSAVRGNERPSPGFWMVALLGSALVAGFALYQSGGSLHAADLLMFMALLLGALGYAEGGRLAQTMGGEAVICWALVLAMPLVAPLLLWNSRALLPQLAAAPIQAWIGFAYVSTCSMFIGFFFWYRGMALGGVARVGQVQLLQPFMTLVGAALLLGEQLGPAHLGFALAVIGVVALGRHMRIARPGG